MAILKHIAKEAGVSVQTVSNVLNRRNKETWPSAIKRAERIRAIARRQNYHPNLLARGLRNKKTQTIGLILRNHALAGPPVTLAKFATIEERAWEHGYRLVIGSSQRQPEREAAHLNEFMGRCVDGVILYAYNADNGGLVERMIANNLPVVTIDSPYEFSTNEVTVDREHGSHLQVAHLLETGRRKIAFFVTGTLGRDGQDKLQGHRRAMEEAGVELDPKLVYHRTSGGSDPKLTGAQVTRQALKDGVDFDAVVTTSDLFATGVMNALLAAGRRIPEDVAIIGFDDDPYTDSLVVPLSTIHQPREVGRIAFDLLHEQMSGEASDNRLKQVVLKPSLVVRRSTDRVEDSSLELPVSPNFSDQ